MNEEQAIIFQSETFLDLPVWNEVCAAFRMTTRKSLIHCILGILLLLYCISVILITPSMALSCLTGIGICGIIVLIRRQKNRNGGKQYQELLKSSGGKTPHNKYSFSSEGIDSHSVHKGTDTHWDYTQVTGIIDSGRLLLLILDTNQFTVIDPRWLTGGTREEIVDFLRSKCTNAKKGIQKVTFGKIVNTLYCGGCVLLLAVALFFSVIEITHEEPVGSISQSLSVEEAAAVLESMDIHCADADIAEVERWEVEYQEYFPDVTFTFTTKDRMISLLSSSGYGSYNPDTWEWTPPDSGVFWLDFEAFNLSRMYTHYLTGLAAISDGALVITDIQENQDQVDWELGTGKIHLSFSLNGSPYQISASVDDDWYDESALDEINRIVNKSGDRQVYVASDNGQGILVFYRSPQWAKEFTDLTGIPLSGSISNLWYGLNF